LGVREYKKKGTRKYVHPFAPKKLRYCGYSLFPFLWTYSGHVQSENNTHAADCNRCRCDAAVV